MGEISAILVPTLAELGIELDRAWAAEQEAETAIRHAGSPVERDHPVNLAFEQAANTTSEIISQIAAMPASSIEDLRVKAKALDWWHRTVEGPDYSFHPPERLAQQIVAGLLGGLT